MAGLTAQPWALSCSSKPAGTASRAVACPLKLSLPVRNSTVPRSWVTLHALKNPRRGSQSLGGFFRRSHVPSPGIPPGDWSRRRAVSAALAAAGAAPLPAALLFDCDGVLVDTERDGHRISFNKAFEEKGLETVWDVDLYGELLKIGGGKERMTHFFNEAGWPRAAPQGPEERRAFIAGLHKRKTELFMEMVETGALPLRPGVARLVDEALSRGVQVAVCSTSNEKAVAAIVRVLLGPERAASMGIYAGDVVARKKPDPAIYTLASTTLAIPPARCVVVEDSHIGLTAAKAAGMTCVITKSGYTADEDFSAADAVYDCIGDAPEERFGLLDLAELLASSSSMVAS